MIQRYLSALVVDDNPQLHRVPFLFFWIASYGLVWLFIYIYENFMYSNYSLLCDFSLWLKGGLSHSATWREDLFIGLLTGLTLSLMQTWLLRRRYSFVPKYWTIATIIGAIIAGFGYMSSLGSSVGGMAGKYFIDDFPIWFVSINLIQAIALFSSIGLSLLSSVKSRNTWVT